MSDDHLPKAGKVCNNFREVSGDGERLLCVLLDPIRQIPADFRVSAVLHMLRHKIIIPATGTLSVLHKCYGPESCSLFMLIDCVARG